VMKLVEHRRALTFKAKEAQRAEHQAGATVSHGGLRTDQYQSTRTVSFP